MYSGFVGTVLSHFLSLISTLWAIFKVHRCNFESDELQYIRLGLLLIAANSSLSIVRYGSVDGYKLRRLHIISLNFCAISYFTILETVFLQMNNAPSILLGFPALNIIPLMSNVFAKDYRTKYKYSDVIIAINSLFFLIVSFFYENYYSSAFSASYFFGYFFIGESGYFLDTEVPSIDAFQYLTCFLNVFAAFMFCY